MKFPKDMPKWVKQCLQVCLRMCSVKRNAFLLALGLVMLVWVCNIVWINGWSSEHLDLKRRSQVSEGHNADYTARKTQDSHLWHHLNISNIRFLATNPETNNTLQNNSSNIGVDRIINIPPSNRKKNKTADMSRGSDTIPKQRTKQVPTSNSTSTRKFSTLFHYRPPITSVNCPSLIQGNKTELERVKHLMKNETRSAVTEKDYLRLASNCSEFRLTRGYVTSSLTTAEKEFPIAFSLLMYKHIEQAERLLRAIYRPQNVYCIHVDKKASAELRKSMEAIARCFGNVFVIQNPVPVYWGTYTVLQPELLCMEELWKYKTWKYFINLTGQEFPLKTNFELVKILTAFNGANNQEGTLQNWSGRWVKAGPPPHGFRPIKGSVHIAVSRKYVDFALHNKTALDLLKWVQRTIIPDETFFATLNHNPQLGVPGSYKGKPETSHLYPFLTRYKIWVSDKIHPPCYGQTVRGICIFGVGDLPAMTLAPHLFVNKFFWNFEHYARDCLEEWHYNKTRNQYLHGTNFDVSYYRNLSFVKYHVN